MYTLAVRREFDATHYLIGGDWGDENHPHQHHYLLELQLFGETLDQHGYLVDIVDVEAHLDALVARYHDKSLNDFPEFAGLNPSIEHFSRILCAALSLNIKAENITRIKVVLWENEIAWAAHEIAR
ncbi:MAG: 6-carboxytetrahydropterin synthase [Anaerolineales bacterium]